MRIVLCPAVFRPDGKAIITRGNLKITPPQNTQVILQVIYGTIHYLGLVSSYSASRSALACSIIFWAIS